MREIKRLPEKSAEQLEAERRARDAERGFFWRHRYAMCAVAAALVIVFVLYNILIIQPLFLFHLIYLLFHLK